MTRVEHETLNTLCYMWPSAVDKVDHCRMCAVNYALTLVITVLSFLKFEECDGFIDDLMFLRELVYQRYLIDTKR